jgi:hypothetical protein
MMLEMERVGGGCNSKHHHQQIVDSYSCIWGVNLNAYQVDLMRMCAHCYSSFDLFSFTPFCVLFQVSSSARTAYTPPHATCS